MGLPPPAPPALRDVRDDVCACLGRRADALFELTDAILAASPVPSPAHLSLASNHRRGWGSLYAAPSQGAVQVAGLRALLARHPPAAARPVYAVDRSVWPRGGAATSPERGFSDHPSRHAGGQLGFARGSWTAPRDVQRVRPTEHANALAVAPIERLVARLPEPAPAPLFVFDAGDDPVQLQQGLGGARAAILVRLRSDRCFDGDPPAPKPTGRPPRHGHKLVCEDPATWPEPTAEDAGEDGQYGAVQARAWAGLHPKVRAHARRGSRGPTPIVRGTRVRAEVSRLPGRAREPQILWPWWHGAGSPDLALLWRAYVRRFDLEHTLRFPKQTLGWTTPRVRPPGQAARWTRPILAADTELRLARGVVANRRLPWERPLAPGRLTPYRVRRAVSALLLALGTPTDAPKPCGRSPGRPRGASSGPATRHPAPKKAAQAPPAPPGSTTPPGSTR